MKSTLHATGDSLLLPLFASVFAHGGSLAMFMVFSVVLTYCGDSKPVIDTSQAMEVAMVSLPKSASRMPDMATRAPEPVGAPTPAPQPAPEVKHTSDLAVKTEKAKANEGVDTKRLEDALKQFERDQALRDMDAALGAITRSATDPDGSDDGQAGGNVGTPSDPEYARYILLVQRTFQDQFHPLKSIRDANPGIVCRVHVSVDAAGTVTGSTITRSSGVPAWDAAAQRAVDAVSSIPLPPEKYRDRLSRGYTIDF